MSKTLTERIHSCKKCSFREMDIQHGVLCSKTHEKPDFEEAECPDFEQDPAYKKVALPESGKDSNHTVDMSSQMFEEARNRQKFPAGLISGMIVGFFLAIIWTLLSFMTRLHLGLLALVVGVVVGYTIRFFGKGVTSSFGIAGAIITLCSCALSNYLSMITILMYQYKMTLSDVLLNFDYLRIGILMVQNTSVMAFLFYLSAAGIAYKFSFREVIIR